MYVGMTVFPAWHKPNHQPCYLERYTDNLGIWLKCTWVIKEECEPPAPCQMASFAVSVTPLTNLPALYLICVAVFVCDYVFHRFTELLFALNLPVFTMNLCLYISWNVCSIHFLSVLAIWNKLNSMDNMFGIVKVAVINIFYINNESFVVINPQIFCFFHFYCSFKAFFSSLFGLFGSVRSHSIIFCAG